MKFHMWRTVFLMAVLALSACAGAPASPATTPGEVRQIVSTTSFGMCVGYCTTRLEIGEERAVLIRQARGGRGAPQELPEQRFTTALSDSEWQEIARLAEETSFEGLPPVIGCPDCADGGAESLSIVGEGEPRGVSFEYGADIAQARALLARVRALRERLTPRDQ